MISWKNSLKAAGMSMSPRPADALGAVQKDGHRRPCASAVSAVFAETPGEWGGAMTVVGVLAYSVQQYCDFSGGIDLVAGIAELFGIRLAENFKRPYFAVSLGDFWRRWHISLGAWMRDYVFYPFALCKPVARLSKAAKKRFGAAFARALPAALGNLLVFPLVGVWHGATSNYILWGLYNGVILALTALMEPTDKRMNEPAAADGFEGLPCLPRPADVCHRQHRLVLLPMRASRRCGCK